MKTKILFFVFACLVFTSCKDQAASKLETASELKDIPSSQQASPSDSKDKGIEEQKESTPLLNENVEVNKAAKIIKNGRLEVEVKTIAETKVLIDSIVKKYKGYFEIDEYNQSEYSSTYNLTIRVTATKFDQLVNEILKLDAVIKHKDINAKDVTAEYIDTESRMNSAKSYLERYKQLLGKAHSIKDIIELETKIQEIQTEMEAHEGRLKYMDDQVAFSTLSMNVSEKHEYFEEKTKEHFGKKILNAFKQGFDILLGLILGLITIWPLILFLIMPFIFRKRIATWWRNRK
jgi:DNA-binding FrmR family transcriptional regulator